MSSKETVTISSEAKKKADRFLQQKLNKEKPKFILVHRGFTAKPPDCSDGRVQSYLNLRELQQLIIASFLPGPRLDFKPEWFILQRCLKATKIAVFLLDCDEIPHDQLSPIFTEKVMFTPSEEWIHFLLTHSLSKGLLQRVDQNRVDKLKQRAKEIPGKVETPKNLASKMDLLLSAEQMLEEGFLFPAPLTDIKKTIRKRYDPVTDDSPMFAVDCEMCLGNNDQHELTRVSIVDEDCKTILDTYVKPDVPIKDYVTRYSGITKEILDPITTSLKDVQKMLRKLIPRNAILCGQSLCNDLKALKVFHPYVIDTSVIFNHSGSRKAKTGLKRLTAHHLGENIQDSSDGHCSVEDSTATMKLVLLKLEKGLDFGDRVLFNGNNFFSKGPNPIISIKDFLSLNEVSIDIFYDSSESHYQNSNRFISVLSSFKKSLLSTLFQIVCVPKKICILLTKDGFCYINV
ncbi:RNA exonuclease 5 [Brevipalpus obovatus]|uniref:RNA exonuclease 5 n=1 Tax=Brevipalpus obovatus TaxID=246614 RepID=UPI003D9E963A